MSELRATSPAFDDGAPIPEKYGYDEENVNPPLRVEGVPDEAASLAVVMDDPDALDPAGKIWDHWVVWNVDPAVEEIPEDWDPSDAGAIEGENDFGEDDYGGPKPPDGRHTYEFTVYALDGTLDLSAGSTKDDLEGAMTGSVVAEATLTGTYAP